MAQPISAPDRHRAENILSDFSDFTDEFAELLAMEIAGAALSESSFATTLEAAP